MKLDLRFQPASKNMRQKNNDAFLQLYSRYINIKYI